MVNNSLMKFLRAMGGAISRERTCTAMSDGAVARMTGLSSQARDHLIPARMNDCTKARWKIRKAISSGAADSRVAAVMIDQSMP